jgi:hypothetical protein
MKFISIFLFTFAIYTSSFGQTDTVTIKPKWNNGDTKKYKIVTSSSVTYSGKIEESSMTTKLIRINVGETKGGFTEMVWNYEKVEFKDSTSEKNPYKELMNTVSRNLIVKYTINDNGEIISINNYNDISNRIKSTTDSTFNVLGKSEKTAVNPMVKMQIGMIYSTNKQLNNVVLNDIFSFHKLYGIPFVKDKPITIEERSSGLPNFVDKFNYTLKSIDSSKSKYSIQGEKQNSSGGSDTKTTLNYEFNFPQNWLTEYNSKLESKVPINIEFFTSIRQIE